MSSKSQKKQLEKIAAEFDAIILDLSEVTILADLTFQTERLRKANKKLKAASTQIHGGGTGDD